MRLLALDLLAYGHLTELRLRFPREAALHVVLGANEAGKSTALSAIADALFGFPHQSPHAFLHEAAQLRIGFELEAADGTRAAFIRRKGRKDTLLDAAGAAVPEAALRRFLGETGRETFLRHHGLDGARLRAGGQELAESGGAAGETLAAGMGLPLRKVLARLEKAADELHGTRHKARRLGAAVEAWRAAERARDAAELRPAAWAEAQEELARIAAELDAAAAQADALKREERQLLRARAARPVLLRLDALRAEVAALSDAPDLPADAADRLRALTAALEAARADAAREADETGRIEAELAALPRDPEALAAQDALDALAPLRAAAEGAARELPGLRGAAAAHRAGVAAAAERLGLTEPPEALRDALPGSAAREAAGRLVQRRTGLRSRLEEAEAGLDAARRRLTRAAAALEAPAPPDGGALRRALEEARAESRVELDLARAEREHAEAATRCASALGALGLWSGDAAALAACALPLEAEAEATAAALEAARGALEEAERRASTLEAEVAAHAGALALLEAAGPVATRAAVAEARAARDAAWSRLRRALESGVADAEDLPAPDAFEALRDRADRLADARADDAGRVSEHAATTARLALARERHAAAEAARGVAAAGLAGAEAAWRALWAPAGLEPRAPAAMREWRAKRVKVLDLAEAASAAARRCAELAERRDAARAALLPHLPDAPAGLGAAIAQAAERLLAVEAAAAARRGLVTERDAARDAAEAAEAARDRAAAALAATDGDWTAALAALRLPAEASEDAAMAALSAWGSIAEAATAWRAEAARIAGMDAAAAALASALAALPPRLGPTEDEAPLAAAARLARRIDAARAAEARAAELTRRLEERRAAARRAAEAEAAAETALARMHAAAGTDALPALAAAVERAAQRAAKRAEAAQRAAELAELGEGLEESALRGEAAGLDPDGMTARLAEVERLQTELGRRREELGAQRQEAQSRVAAMPLGRDAAEAAQDARDALAAATAAAERYARLHAARVLLKAGMERLRQDRQGPMLGAAAAHFRELTGGRYVRLRVDEEEEGEVVLRAVRDDGTSCPMDALSEGARDQLFLALRVADLGLRAEAGAALPFVADDLLASFDEARAAAALRLLAGLGRQAQVILFTHHAHVAALAAEVPGAHVQRLETALPPARGGS